MRKEATIEQWKELYEVATRLKEMKPWETFWDLDVIGIQSGKEEDMAFYSILGHGGGCYGIVVYEGYEGLNDFMMISMQETLNLPVDYVMHQQNNLTCYWGDRNELSAKQRAIVKELGYKYRGKNQWLYFLSFEPGYYPYNLDQSEVFRMTNYFRNLELALQYYESAQVDQDEVVRMTEHFLNLEIALQHYDKLQVPVDFEHGEMFCLAFNEDKKSWNFGARPLPSTAFQFGNLIITDDELLGELAEAPKCDVVLEVDIAVLGISVSDKQFKRPANPATCMIADAASGMMLKCELQEPEEDLIASLAEEIVGFILQIGAPKEIRVSNILVESGLEQICLVCGVKLRRVKRLRAI